MDPSMVVPPLDASAVEPHKAPAANPTPSAVTNHGVTHPPYAEMITAAIEALKEKNGSSRRAIAKYIEDTYSNLPNTHSALLTLHLRRLKSAGVLLMVKHSYQLPRSAGSGSVENDPSAAVSGIKRGPGRPPKPRPSGDHLNPDAQTDLNPTFVALGLADEPGSAGEAQQSKRGRGRPPKPGPPRPRRRPGMAAAAAGLNSGEGKRSRGRPKKERPPSLLENAVARALSVKRRGRPPGSGGVRKPKKLGARPVGRPRKSNIAPAEVQLAVGQQTQMANHAELKLKFQHFQSKIKEAVGVLRPYIAGREDGGAPAFAALQELEEMAELDAGAPIAAVQVPLL